MKDTRATRWSARLPAGNGPCRLPLSTTTPKVRVIAEPSDISRVMKETPVMLPFHPRSTVMKARLPSPAEAHSVARLPSRALAAL